MLGFKLEFLQLPAELGYPALLSAAASPVQADPASLEKEQEFPATGRGAQEHISAGDRLGTLLLPWAGAVLGSPVPMAARRGPAPSCHSTHLGQCPQTLRQNSKELFASEPWAQPREMLQPWQCHLDTVTPRVHPSIPSQGVVGWVSDTSKLLLQQEKGRLLGCSLLSREHSPGVAA